MADYHIVEQGEYLSKIAFENGFLDHTIIWDHPNNAQLKQDRKNPNVLFPGDKLFIPDMEQRQESGATDQHHKFAIKQEKLMLRLVLEDIYEKPIANAPCKLIVDDESFDLITDSKGKIEQEIPSDAHEAVLVIKGDQTPFQGDIIPIKIGHLDPVEEVSGQQARLNNLGYFAGDGAKADAPDFHSAVEEFQCDHHLKVDGICGPVTRAKLKDVHGC
jgi:N-acetylmuramoyl-L-alanine amidase